MPLEIKVLLVEDNTGDARLIREMLAESTVARFALHGVEHLAAALSYLETNPVDIILLDLSLPDSQGLDSLNKILKRFPAAAVVVLSGLDDEDIALRAVHSGAQDYLIKGQVDYQLLVRSLRYGLERKRSEMALRKAVAEAETERAKNEAIVAGIGIGICIVDLDFRITYQNRISRDLEGNRVGELCYKYCAGEDRVCGNCPVAKALKDGKTHRLPRKLKTNGDNIYLEILGSPLLDDEQNIVGGIKVVVDVSERKKAELELERLNTRNRLILDTAGEGILGLDLDGRHTFVNPAAAKMLGFEVDELVGKFSHTLWHHTKADGSPYPFEDCPIYAAFKEGKVRRGEDEFFWRRDGSGFPVRYVSTPIYEKGLIAGAVVTFTDISERKRAEEVLRESEERYRDLFENANDLIQSVDKEGRFLYVNRSWLETLGYSGKDLQELTMFDIICAGERAHCEKLFKKVFTGEKIDRVEVTFRTKDGRKIFVEGSVNAKIIDGRTVSSRGIFRNITERKKIAEEKERMQVQLLHAQKMEAVGTLAGGVAHDFNNILTTIQGYTELVMREVDKEAPFYSELEAVKSSCHRAAGIVRQLLLFSRKKVMELKPLNINEAVTDFSMVLQRLLGEKVEIVIDLAADVSPVMADYGNIEQVIMNLAVNARDAMPDGGRLFIKTGNVEIDAAYCKRVSQARPGKFICLTLADEGEGLGAEVMEHIYEPFFTTKEVGKGTGLGLSVVYGIVNEHQGWIDVESKPGNGATFRIYLPAITKNMLIDRQTGELLFDLEGHGERVLLIEDEKDLRELAMAALERGGYTVFAAASGKEAYALYDKEKGRFDLVFSDVVLPDTNGVRIVERLLEKKPGLKILLTSGYTDDKAQRAIIEGRKYRFLEKPYSIPVLLRTFKELLTG